MTYIAEIKDIPYDKKRADVVLSDGEICRAFKATIKEYGLVEGKNIDFAELKRIAKEGEEHIAFTTAIDSLSRGIKSQNEVRKNLKTKKSLQKCRKLKKLKRLCNLFRMKYHKLKRLK